MTNAVICKKHTRRTTPKKQRLINAWNDIKTFRSPGVCLKRSSSTKATTVFWQEAAVVVVVVRGERGERGDTHIS